MKKMSPVTIFIWIVAVLFPNVVHSQCVTNLVVIPGPCDAQGQVLLDIEVYADSQLTGEPFNFTVRTSRNSANGYSFTYTGTPTRVFIPHRGCGDAQLFLTPCGLTTNIPMPSCPQAWAITEFSQVSATPTSGGEMELVTKVVAELPQPEAVLYFGFNDPPRPVFNGTNIYTNVVAIPRRDPDPITVTLRADTDTFFSLGMHCNIAYLDFDTAGFCASNGCPYIADADFTFGPCNSDGTAPVTVELTHGSIPAGAYFVVDVFDSIKAGPFPVMGSPQTETFLIPHGGFFGSFIVRVFSSSGEQLFAFEKSATGPDCPRQPCEILAFDVVATSGCRPDGTTEVIVRTTSSNCSPFDIVEMSSNSSNRPRAVFTNNVATNVLYLQGPGPVTLNVVVDSPSNFQPVLATSIVEQVADCPNLCEIISLEPLVVGDCLSSGDVEVTFALTASNALGSSFAFWSSEFAPFVLSDTICFSYTNTPTIFRARLPAMGASFPGSVAQLYPGTKSRRQDCVLRVDDIATLPNCFQTPPVCVQFPPRIFSTEISDLVTGRLSYTVPTDIPYRIEQTDDLNQPWSVLIERSELVSGNAERSVLLPSAGETRFYRIRCNPTPIPVAP